MVSLQLEQKKKDGILETEKGQTCLCLLFFFQKDQKPAAEQRKDVTKNFNNQY